MKIKFDEYNDFMRPGIRISTCIYTWYELPQQDAKYAQVIRGRFMKYDRGEYGCDLIECAKLSKQPKKTFNPIVIQLEQRTLKLAIAKKSQWLIEIEQEEAG